jgi:acetoin utilization deacetylase AcuC-like enzyme
LKRVAVVDFDVHHGNGTQALFAQNPDLFYASSHQSPFYPGTGDVWDRGIANNIINVPLRARDGSAAFRDAWAGGIIPELEAFAPELLIISAGFDAHREDPLAQIRLETDDFAWITDALCAVARKYAAGRVVSMLEGGYDLEALAASAAIHVRGLMQA